MTMVTIAVDKNVTRIACTAAHALVQADLDDALQAVTDRMLRADRLVEAEMEPGGRLVMRLRPFAELTLCEITRIAGLNTDSATKTRLIVNVLNLAGY